MARLDRLGSAKEVAQVGSAIGREFSHALLAAVARKPDVELQSALDRLIAAGLLFRHGMPPHATYLFKHALVQDAAYGTLLRERRRALHARIADTLESEFIDVAESQPELVARHCTEASLTAIKDARETSHAATLLYALTCTNLTQIACGNYEAVRAQSDEAIALADEKGGTPFWRAHATIELGCLLVFTGKAADAARVITAGLDAYRSTGATMYLPWHLSSLASDSCKPRPT
jgi:hypothetical protein